MKLTTKKLTLLAILLALCVIGANIRILGSIALDSFPAFIGAAILGPVTGLILGFFGHMISATLSGFQQTIPIHLIIAALMALCMFVYGWLKIKLKDKPLMAAIIPAVAGYLINVPLDLLILYPILGPGIFALFVPLSLATIVNLIMSEIVLVGLPKKIKQKYALREHS